MATREQHEQFEWYSREMETAQGECARTYAKWTEACQRLHKLERERSNLFTKMVAGETETIG